MVPGSCLIHYCILLCQKPVLLSSTTCGSDFNAAQPPLLPKYSNHLLFGVDPNTHKEQVFVWKISHCYDNNDNETSKVLHLSTGVSNNRELTSFPIFPLIVPPFMKATPKRYLLCVHMISFISCIILLMANNITYN